MEVADLPGRRWSVWRRFGRRPGVLASDLMQPKPPPPPWCRLMVACFVAWVALVGLVVGVIWLVGRPAP